MTVIDVLELLSQVEVVESVACVGAVEMRVSNDDLVDVALYACHEDVLRQLVAEESDTAVAVDEVGAKETATKVTDSHLTVSLVLRVVVDFNILACVHDAYVAELGVQDALLYVLVTGDCDCLGGKEQLTVDH